MQHILHPYLTEKSAATIDQGLYVFLVRNEANKNTVAKELKALYDVTPISIRMVNLPAKRVNFKRKPGFRSAIRKAYVQLPPKQKIPGFESLTEKESKKEAKAAKEETK